MLLETYTPDRGPWVELPASTSKHWDFGERVGSLVYRINPHYLAYWNPDVAGRGFLFLGLFFGAMCWLFGYVWLLVPALWATAPPENIPWLMAVSLPMIMTLLGPACMIGAYLSARKPLPPPIHFNRKLQRVLQYQKVPGHKAEWLDWQWSDITAAVRQVHVYSIAGRSTMYVLVLMQLEAGTNKILRSFGAYNSVAEMRSCVAAWEYMRRYMNEPPELVPAAYVPPFGFDPKTWAVRCQIESMQWGIKPDGSFKNWFDRLFMPIAGTVIYPFMWATLWIEKTAPKIALPAELAKLNEWDEQQPNPYKIEQAWGGGEEGDPPLEEVYQRIKLRHRIMSVLGFGWFGGLLLLMLAYGWAGVDEAPALNAAPQGLMKTLPDQADSQEVDIDSITRAGEEWSAWTRSRFVIASEFPPSTKIESGAVHHLKMAVRCRPEGMAFRAITTRLVGPTGRVEFETSDDLGAIYPSVEWTEYGASAPGLICAAALAQKHGRKMPWPMKKSEHSSFVNSLL